MRRFAAQGNFANYARTGTPVKHEDDPFDPLPPRQVRESGAAMRHLEDAVLGALWTEGIVLRYGALYGPGTSFAPRGQQTEMIRKRKFPLVGDGGPVWSFVHIADAADATVAAVENGSRGVYNVVDDDPAPVAEWLPALARTLGAKKPRRVPRFVVDGVNWCRDAWTSRDLRRRRCRARRRGQRLGLGRVGRASSGCCQRGS